MRVFCRLTFRSVLLLMSGVCVGCSTYRLGVASGQVTYAVAGVLIVVASIGFFCGSLVAGNCKGGWYGAVVGVLGFVLIPILCDILFGTT